MFRTVRQRQRGIMPDTTGRGPLQSDLAELHLVVALAGAYALGYGREAVVRSTEPPSISTASDR